MIEAHNIPVTDRVMTGITLLSSLYMVGVLSGGIYPIMTVSTAPSRLHTRVVEAGVSPVAGRVMAGIALFSGLDMGVMHTRSLNTVVTA